MNTTNETPDETTEKTVNKSVAPMVATARQIRADKARIGTQDYQDRQLRIARFRRAADEIFDEASKG